MRHHVYHHYPDTDNDNKLNLIIDLIRRVDNKLDMLNDGQKLNLLIQKLDLFMATAQEQFDTLMARLNTITNDIAADYQKLLEEIQNGTISQASLDAAAANIAQLEALGASVENPVPEPPPAPEG